MEPGHRLLVDDGRLLLVAEKADGKSIVAKVVSGTKISNKKGVSLPDTTLGVGALTEKDRKDLDAILQEDVDWVALSFIQRPDDLAEVRKIARGRVGLLSKIEKPQAVERLDEIIELSDAIMVARGDLGVEMPLEAVPGIQKQITRATRRAGKPVIVATQMLESMISAPVPTRAEVSDVATAVFEGADAVMLSAESAAGDYPVEAVETMSRIAEKVELDSNYPGIINAQRPEAEATGPDAISAAARQIAQTLKLSAIVCYTSSGTTGMRASRERPSTPVIALSPGRPDRAAAGACLGAALCGHRGCDRSGRHGRPGLPDRVPRAVRQARRPDHHHGRRSAAHAGRHQHAAHRLYRFRRPVGYLILFQAALDRAEPVVGDCRFERARLCLQVAGLAAELLDRRNDEIGGDMVRLVAEIGDPHEFDILQVPRQPVGMDARQDDRVPVAGNHHRRGRNPRIMRRGFA